MTRYPPLPAIPATRLRAYTAHVLTRTPTRAARAPRLAHESIPDDLDDLPPCVSQSAPGTVPAAYRAVCTHWGTRIAISIHCPVECGGHPICPPCLDLAIDQGILREVSR